MEGVLFCSACLGGARHMAEGSFTGASELVVLLRWGRGGTVWQHLPACLPPSSPGMKGLVHVEDPSAGVCVTFPRLCI